ncbi:MAG TPA: hypothetical protein VGB82_15230 [Alphaproteobacteria bacterium]
MATIPTPAEGIAVVTDEPAFSYVQWGPIAAGAVAAAALAFVLHGFAASIGLAVSSAAPTWRDASPFLWILSGVYLLLVALASYGLGGYIAGRMREALTDGTAEEVEARDGTHGLLVWGLATLLTGLMVALAAPVAVRLAAPSSGEAGPAVSIGGENIIAYDLDRLFRSEVRPVDEDISYNRAEAARILLTASGHDGVSPEDRTYLIGLVGQRTGLSPADATRRVDSVIASAKQNIERARKAGVVLAFMAGAAALVGAAAAWYAALTGGRHRDSGIAFLWGNGIRRRSVLG